MATAKKTPASTSTAVAVKKTGANVVSIKDVLAAQLLALQGKTQAAGGNMIRCGQDKKFKLPDGSITDGPLQLVVIDFASVNKYYPGAFDQNNISPPVCQAMSASPLNMTPLAASPEMQVDAGKGCNQCAMNVFGSSGNGKACKNTRVLAVLPPDAGPDTPLWLLTTSPTANKNWDAYVAGVVRTYGAAPIAVVTEVGFDSNKSFPSLVFGNPEANANIADHVGRIQEANELLMAEPDFSSYVKAPPARGRAAPAPAAAAAAARRPVAARR